MRTEAPRTLLDLSSELSDGLSDQRPAVALESTIVCHGMPYPQNVETALRIQDAIRDEGATPAMIAIIDGRLKAGLDDTQIEFLGREGQQITKASRRDIPFLVAGQGNGATTVAATMIVSSLAGIPVFATGGIGGVHRGAESSMDISADLQELAQTDVAVVCAGVKSVLDIPKTLEYLETQGVPVVGFGTDTLPAFYTQSSGLPVDYRVDDAAGVASALHAKWTLGLRGGMVIAAPVPEAHALDPDEIETVIAEAIGDMQQRGITGKATTPFLLSRIAEKTAGRSLAANIELAVNNARVAARISRAYAQLQDETRE
jgi:pseudouridine-5'-phosphate glycosidase